MNKWDKRARIAGALGLLALSAFLGYGIYFLSTSPVPPTRLHSVWIPDGAEVRSRDKIHSLSFNASTQRSLEPLAFVIDLPLQEMKLKATQRESALIIAFSFQKLEYWLPRGDGIVYYAFETAPPTKESEADFSKDIRFDPVKKAFVYSFGRPLGFIVFLGALFCGVIIFGIFIVLPVFQEIKK